MALFSEFTVGMLQDGGVIADEAKTLKTLTVAQGEVAVEDFLWDVRDLWTKQELNMVLNQNRVNLIRGTSGLVLMKASRYCRAVREIQKERELWEERLTKLRGSFGAWIDVWCLWVYQWAFSLAPWTSASQHEAVGGELSSQHKHQHHHHHQTPSPPQN